MRFYSRRTITLFAAALAAATLASQVQAQDPKVIRFGAAYPKSGPMAGGAAATHAPNIALWLHEVNAKGGLMLSSIGRRVPIELVEYDDRTSNEDTVRAIERLVTQDKVDFLLAPYATGANMAVAALFNRYGYPQLVATAVTDRGPEFAKRWPNSFWLAGGGTAATQSLVEVLKELRDQGKIGKRIAMVSVADAFGIDLATAGRKVFKDNGFEIVMDASYPLGTQDVAPIISEAKRLDPDAFIAFSYPPDTFAITEQARIASFNPKVFYAGVGTVFPTYKAKFGTAIEGIMGIGGWNPDLPETKAYIARHKEVTGKEPEFLGQFGGLCEFSDARAGDRARGQPRSRGHHQGHPERHLRYRARQGEARRQPTPRLVGWPMAERQLLRPRTDEFPGRKAGGTEAGLAAPIGAKAGRPPRTA